MLVYASGVFSCITRGIYAVSMIYGGDFVLVDDFNFQVHDGFGGRKLCSVLL